jgi:hypothetical protein
MQHGIQQRIVDVNCSVVADEPQFSELVHEKADTRPGCPDHFRQCFLTDLNIDRLRNAILTKMGKN